ncbi:hypothetical protein VKT23_019560 [Stygiomarasmius scandens]|uniref:F-box domain-containing protein n=1 Tax=Marasmiellus scandens TaxID=2682957 RepID=A0ABR1IL08_9AGAR
MDGSIFVDHISQQVVLASTHRAFEINEILFSILQNCNKQTLACCVQVSHLWLEGGLDVLWREVANIEDLLKPLGGVVERSRTIKVFDCDLGNYENDQAETFYEFSSMPTHKQWIKFQQRYASRIHALRFALTENNKHKTLCLVNLLRSIRFSGPILPNLRTIYWDNLSGKGLEEPFLAFVHEDIQQLVLKDTGDYSLGKVITLETIPSCMPCLTELIVKLPTIEEYVLPLTNIVKGLKSLQSLTLPSNGLKAVPSLFGLRKLKKLRILGNHGPFMASQLPRSTGPGKSRDYFPALEALEIHCEYEAVSNLLCQEFHCLTMIQISCTDSGGKSVEVQNILFKISAFCPCISKIELIMRRNRGKLPSPTRCTTEHQLSLTAFRPILTNSSISSFTLQRMLPLEFGLRDMTTISSAWPRLRSLYLCYSPIMSSFGSNIGLEALLPFASNCPDLEELGLFVDAKSSDTTFDWRAPPSSFRRLRILDVGKSVIAQDAEGAVAQFLSLVCTPGCIIRYYDPGISGYFMAKRWKAVNDMLPHLFSLRLWYERRMVYELGMAERSA